MSTPKKPAKPDTEIVDVKDLRPTKDAKGGAQKKEVPANRGVLVH
jgi:hypothetical protein